MTRAGVTPSRVIDTAADIIDQQGPEALTLAAVAQQLGIRTPSLYSHVDGIEALRRQVGLRSLRILGDEIRSAAMGRAGTEAVAAIATAYRRVALAHPGGYALTQVAHTDDPEWQEVSAWVLEPILATLAAMGIDGDAAIHATRLVRSALHGFVMLEVGGGFGLDVSVDESFDRIVAGLAAAVATP